MKIELNLDTQQTVPFAQIQTREQLAFLGQYNTAYLWCNLIGATFMGAISWALHPENIFVIGIWYVAIMVMNAMRWTLDLDFKPSRYYTLHQLEKMLQQQLLYTIVISALWGASGFLLFSYDIQIQAIHALLLGMIAISSLPMLTLANLSRYLQIAVLILPLVFSLSILGELVPSVLALMLVMMGVGIILVTHIFEYLLKQLSETQVQLLEQTNRDPITQVPNRRYFEQVYKAEWQRAARTGESVALLMADIDCFKQYNDLKGHHQGDVVLKRVARALRQVVRRTSDVVVRYEGDRFAVLLPNTGMEDATRLAEKMCKAIDDLQLDFAKEDFERNLTVSIGVSFCHPTPVRQHEQFHPKDFIYPAVLLNAVDRALYRAKRNGRNQVVQEYCGDEEITRAAQHMDALRAAKVA